MRRARLAASEGGGALQKKVDPHHHPALRPSEWRVDVAFKGSGGALAVEWDGVVEGVTPDELLELVTGAGWAGVGRWGRDGDATGVGFIVSPKRD